MPSLTTLRITTLEETNKRVQKQLGSLLEIAKRNEEKFHWLKNLVLSLMDVRDLTELDETLGQELIGRNNIDEACLFLWDVEDSNTLSRVRSVEALGPLEERFRDLTNPVCETMRINEYTLLFGKKITEPTSVALVPISYCDVQGLLAIGSEDPMHFRLDMSTMFLDFVGEVVARVVASNWS